MAIKVVCPSCLRRLKFAPSASGLSRKCPACNAEITVPGDPGPLSGPNSTRRTEFIIAGVILVVALIGAFVLLKWFQSGQPGHPAPSSSFTPSKPVSETATPPSQPSFKPLSASMISHQLVFLGPARAEVLRVETASETPVRKAVAIPGRVFAVVSVELRSVQPGPPFDTNTLSLVTPDHVEYRVFAVSGVQTQAIPSGTDLVLSANPYEDPRRSVSSTDTNAGPVKLDLYFSVPAALDPKTCSLSYK